jgi:hypothetical protein
MATMISFPEERLAVEADDCGSRDAAARLVLLRQQQQQRRSVLAPNLLPEGGSVPNGFFPSEENFSFNREESKQHPTTPSEGPASRPFSETKSQFDHEIFSFNRSTPKQ